jgi:hypothetical protein
MNFAYSRTITNDQPKRGWNDDSCRRHPKDERTTMLMNDDSIVGDHKECIGTGLKAMGCSIPYPPDTASMKQTRKTSTFAVGVATGVTGLLVGGPVVGIVAGAVVTKRVLKNKEQKALAKYQEELAEALPSMFCNHSS